MYQIFGLRTVLTAYAILCGGITALYWMAFGSPAHIDSLWHIFSIVVSVVGGLTWLVGQTKAFPLVCRWPLISIVMPDIDGTWTGVLHSNWPRVQQRAPLNANTETVALLPVKITVQITARFLFVHLRLSSENEYSRSKTIMVRPVKDPQDGRVGLHYIYENDTASPKTTDCDRHFGAARLDLHGAPGNQTLSGLYWTNRNWSAALNTAGTITLLRPTS